jgi:hypothetical protein
MFIPPKLSEKPNISFDHVVQMENYGTNFEIHTIITDFPIAEHLKYVIKSKWSDFLFMLQVIKFLLSNCELNTVKQHFEM